MSIVSSFRKKLPESWRIKLKEMTGKYPFLTFPIVLLYGFHGFLVVKPYGSLGSEREELSLEFRRCKLSDFISLITLYRKVAPATLYYWPGLLQPPNLRNITRWLLRAITIICALINNFSKFLMYLKPDKSIPFLFIGAFSSRNLIGVFNEEETRTTNR